MPIDVAAVAVEALSSLTGSKQIEAFSRRFPDLGLDDAYRVTAQIRRHREARGEVVVGRKIGFTNRVIWSEFGIDAPAWGYMYDQTVHRLADLAGTFSLARLQEPRIEPEVIFKLATAPTRGMDELALLGCVDWVAHGFEVVHSIFPAWKFSAPDAVIAFGLHGALLIGPTHRPRGGDWYEGLSNFEIDLVRNEIVVDRGHARNVLGGPLSALRHLVDLLSLDSTSPPLAAGEIITTGTLTRAMPIKPSERWATKLNAGALFEPISILL